jgi:hypothetical protein
MPPHHMTTKSPPPVEPKRKRRTTHSILRMLRKDVTETHYELLLIAGY